MDIVKINLKSPVHSSRELKILDMKEENGELLIKLDGKECFDISAREYLQFKRYIDRGDFVDIIEEDVEVIEEDENHIIHTTIPRTRQYTLERVVNIREDSDGNEYERKEIKCDEEIHSGETYHRVTCSIPTELFQQDIEAAQNEMYFMSYDGELLATAADIFVPNAYSHLPMSIDDCLLLEDVVKSCGKDYRNVEIYRYTFAPSERDRKGILISGLTDGLSEDVTFDDLLANSEYVEFKFNPFYYYTINEEIDEFGGYDVDSYGDFVKHCHLWGDVWWDKIQTDEHPKSKQYINSEATKSVLVKPEDYWTTSMGFSLDSDSSALGSDDTFSSNFISDIENSLIPEFIDMERVKYSPIISGESVHIADSLIFNFHFKKRVMTNTVGPNTNTDRTKDNQYLDGWYVDSNDPEDKWWNGFNYSESAFSPTAFEDFWNKSGSTSDLLGYLNIKDDDVYYRKKKVNKSFIRLTFYTSTDPVTQRLLYYSTVFLDGTGLYGKFLKAIQVFEDNNNLSLAVSGYPSSQIVFCNDKRLQEKLTSQISVTNEFDKTRSSEGYNLYLFADDAFIKDEGNDYRTIYMKVEFNHAGNGKTIPMILWPRDENGEFIRLTNDNFLKSLYIPVRIAYLNKRYVYSIPDAINKDGNIIFNLFEPKLDQIENSNYGDN